MLLKGTFRSQLCWAIFLGPALIWSQLVVEGTTALALGVLRPPSIVAENVENTITSRLPHVSDSFSANNAKGVPKFAPQSLVTTQRMRTPSTYIEVGIPSSLVSSPRLSTAIRASSELSALTTKDITTFPNRIATSTTTVPITVVVPPTLPTMTAEDLLPSNTNIVQEARQPDTHEAMSPTAQLGMGFGITFGLLTIAGAAGSYVWHYRRRSRNTDENGHCKVFGKLLTVKRQYHNKDDSEWSIGSAKQVSFVSNMRAQSVRTVSRSDSRGSDQPASIRTKPVGLPLRMALTSHPLTPGYPAFTSSPSEANLELRR